MRNRKSGEKMLEAWKRISPAVHYTPLPFSLFVLFWATMLNFVFEDHRDSGVDPQPTFGFSSGVSFTAVLLTFNFIAVTSVAGFTLLELRKLALRPVVRLRATGREPELYLEESRRFHTFMTHMWATGQDLAHSAPQTRIRSAIDRILKAGISVGSDRAPAADPDAWRAYLARR